MYNQEKKIYRANHSLVKKRRDDEAVIAFWRRTIKQSLAALCILMGIMLLGRFPQSDLYGSVRPMILNDFPFSRYNEFFQSTLMPLFPFSHRVPAQYAYSELPAVPVLGGDASPQDMLTAAALFQTILSNIEIRGYADGVIVSTYEGAYINSFVTGIVTDKGIDNEREIGGFVTIQLPNDWHVTIGFLENIAVSRMEHIQIGDVLGTGTYLSEFEENSFYYIALKDQNGTFVDILDYIRMLDE